MPKCNDFVELRFGDEHLAYAHYPCVKDLTELLAWQHDINPDAIMAYSLPEKAKETGLKFTYEDLVCSIVHG